jgi:hypothetical protein
VITWKNKNQTVVVRSSVEAKYQAMSHTTCELVWLNNFLQEIGFRVPTPMTFFLLEYPLQMPILLQISWTQSQVMPILQILWTTLQVTTLQVIPILQAILHIPGSRNIAVIGTPHVIPKKFPRMTKNTLVLILVLN